MKIIVNSKTLFAALTEAERHDAFNITIERGVVKFQALALNDVATYSYELYGEVMERSEDFKLDRVAAYRLRCFIKGLEEQPIVVKIYDDQINVSCEKTFRW